MLLSLTCPLFFYVAFTHLSPIFPMLLTSASSSLAVGAAAVSASFESIGHMIINPTVGSLLSNVSSTVLSGGQSHHNHPPTRGRNIDGHFMGGQYSGGASSGGASSGGGGASSGGGGGVSTVQGIRGFRPTVMPSLSSSSSLLEEQEYASSSNSSPPLGMGTHRMFDHGGGSMVHPSSIEMEPMSTISDGSGSGSPESPGRSSSQRKYFRLQQQQQHQHQQQPSHHHQQHYYQQQQQQHQQHYHQHQHYQHYHQHHPQQQDNGSVSLQSTASWLSLGLSSLGLNSLWGGGQRGGGCRCCTL